MKTMLFSAALMIPAAAMAAPPAQVPVQAPVQAPAKAMPAPAHKQAPAQAPVQAPGGKMAEAPMAGGYRSFSYEPGYAPAPVIGGGFSTFQGDIRPATAGPGFHDAGFKVRGHR